MRILVGCIIPRPCTSIVTIIIRDEYDQDMVPVRIHDRRSEGQAG